MKWFTKLPEVGENRITKWFALFPVTVFISDFKKETRWLVWVKVRQEFVEAFSGVDDIPVYFWNNEEFVDE